MSVDTLGYVRTKRQDGSWDREHRIIIEQIIGRKLTSKEIVHHKNTIRDDNRAVNLELCASQKLHFKYHRRAKQIWLKCDNCGKWYPLTEGQLANRRNHGCSKFFCSRRCFENNLKGKPFSGKSHRWPKGFDPPWFRAERERRRYKEW